LRQAAIKARNEDKFIKDILINHERINGKLSKEELDDLLDPHKYIGKAIEQVENLANILKKKHDL